jgi:hypothetical protein
MRMFEGVFPRKFERHPYLTEATLRVGEGPARRAHLFDLGRKGSGLFAADSVPVGEAVELTVGSEVLGGRIAWARFEPDGNRFGITFARTLTDDQIRKLFARRSTGSPAS